MAPISEDCGKSMAIIYVFVNSLVPTMIWNQFESTLKISAGPTSLHNRLPQNKKYENESLSIDANPEANIRIYTGKKVVAQLQVAKSYVLPLSTTILS